MKNSIRSFVSTLAKLGIVSDDKAVLWFQVGVLESYWKKHAANMKGCQENHMTTSEQFTFSTSSTNSTSSKPISTSQESNDGGIEVYSDGSGTLTHLAGGWGYVILENGEQVSEDSGHIEKASNNIAELMAAIKGMEHAIKKYPNQQITLVSDSMLVLNYATGTWRVKAMHLTPLFIKIRRLHKQIGFKTRWVKGHSGNPHNTRADALAKRARLSLLPQSS